MADAALLTSEAEGYRSELMGYCYRFFASYAEAEDAVQETMLRAWRHGGHFEGRSSLRTWLYRMATNICLDMQKAPQRRSLPTALSEPGAVPEDPRTLTTRPEQTWIGPIADAHLAIDPAEVVASRETVRLAFLAALQLLPPRQRAVLILRDVLSWSAAECAALLETSVPAVNSALQRAREALGAYDARDAAAPTDAEEVELLARYVKAFEAFDVDALVGLLADDARFSMPPYELWLEGADPIAQWWRGPGQVCVNSRTRLLRANGQPAVAVYHDVGAGRWEAFAVHLLDGVRRGDGLRIGAITHFMGPGVFRQLGLPVAVGDDAREICSATDESAPRASSTS